MPLDEGRTKFVKKAFYDRFNPDEEYLGNEKPVNKIEPLVSICVPAYQHEEFIEECLDSILMQKTSFPFEILIGEDQSEDNTRAICKKYAEKHTDKIRLFLRDRETSQLFDENGNLLLRFNVKWLRVSSKGKYIALCEGDDYWTDEYKLQKQIDFMEANPGYSMCFHNAEVIYTYKPDSHKFVEIEEADYTGVDLYEKRLIPTASVVFLANCISGKDYFFNSNFFFGDLVLFLTLAECGRIRFINETMSVYRKHKGGMMYGVFHDSENVRKFIIHQKQILRTFPRKYKKPGFKNISWFYFILFRSTFKADFLGSAAALFKSFYYSPQKCLELFMKFLKTRFNSNSEQLTSK